MATRHANLLTDPPSALAQPAAAEVRAAAIGTR